MLGIVAGALGAFLALRPALVERRRSAREVIELRSELAAERSVLDERLAAAVKTLSSEALDANSARFFELADARLSGYVARSPTPTGFRSSGSSVVRQEAYGALASSGRCALGERRRPHERLAHSARARTLGRGRSCATSSRKPGCSEHCDYIRQATSRPTTIGVLRPDLVVRIPGGKHVVVDAKAPLVAYLDAFETSDETERARHLADHARQVREHVVKLSAKHYWRQFEPSPDFVIMFLPDESYLRAAHEHDAALPRTPGAPTSFSLRRARSSRCFARWPRSGSRRPSRKARARSSSLGRELYERIGNVGAHLSKLGRSPRRLGPVVQRGRRIARDARCS